MLSLQFFMGPDCVILIWVTKDFADVTVKIVKFIIKFTVMIMTQLPLIGRIITTAPIEKKASWQFLQGATS